MRIQPFDFFLLVFALACFILIIGYNQHQAWGGLALVIVAYLVKNTKYRKAKRMTESISRLESLARHASWFALDNSEKADSLITAQAAIWVLLGTGETVEEVLADPDCGRIVATTRPADDMFLYAEGMLVGKSLKSLIPERFHTHHDQFFAHYSLDPQPRQMGGQRAELPGLRKDGTEFLLEIGLHPKFIRMRQLALATLAVRRA